MGEVDHLLPRDAAWRHAHAFALDAMIATQQQVTGVGETRLQCLLYQAYLQGQLLQSAQRTFGFVQVVYLRLNLWGQAFIYGMYCE
jgi:hypothetical protein